MKMVMMWFLNPQFKNNFKENITERNKKGQSATFYFANHTTFTSSLESGSRIKINVEQIKIRKLLSRT